MSANLSWVATEARTGAIIADLPDLAVESVKRSLGQYEPATATLPLPTAPQNWERATLEGATNLILLAENPSDPSHGVPIWGGMITRSTRGRGDTIELTLATLEAYTDRRFVGDITFSATGQNDIVKSLIDTYVATGPNGGVPIRVQFATAGVGARRDRTYTDDSDKSIYSVLSELSAVIGGPEWTIEWEWQHGPERITPVLYVGDRIGNAVPAGLGPAASFDMPGSVTDVTYVRDYSSSNGATDVMAVSSANADLRPKSPHIVTPDPSRPTFEYRWTPSTSITDVGTLTDHARAAAAALADGLSSVSLAASMTNAPRLGVDWSIGDDIGFSIGGIDEAGLDTVPAFPGGLSGTARAIGWELTLGNTPIITPILTDPTGGA